MKEKVESLETQVSSLQQKVINLEAKLKNPKYALRDQNKAPDATKTKYTLKAVLICSQMMEKLILKFDTQEIWNQKVSQTRLKHP